MRVAKNGVLASAVAIWKPALGLMTAFAAFSTAQAQYNTDGLDEQARQVINEPNFGSPFDDRFYLGASVGFVFADKSDYDNGPAFQFSLGKTLYENLALQGELHYSSLEVSDVGNSGSTADYERLAIAATAHYFINLDDRFKIGPTAGIALRQIDFLSAEEDGFAVHAGVGAVLRIANRLDLTLDGRYNLDITEGEGAIDETTFYTWNALVGLRMSFGDWPPNAPDSDGDGVPDYRDDCPNTPPGVEVNARGCGFDSDGDGVPDHRDRCPNTPKGIPVDEYGCPQDSDGDGVPDMLDECPGTPPGVPVNAQGCPLDSDQDGVIDAKDLCPNTPFGAEVDVHGCPFDTDQDGVPDYRDDCPNTPFGTPVNDRGCPLDADGDGVPDSIDQCPNTYPGLEVDKVGCPIKNQVLTLHNVHFEFDRADLLPDSMALLSRVAKSLMDQPNTKIEVAGHTDALGSDAYNLKLSDRRAAAVRGFLVSRGVTGSNIYSKGYGERVPVASNETDEGRALNRRVEIHLLED